MGGSKLLLLLATTFTEKSSIRKAFASIMNAAARNIKTPRASVGAIFMAALLLRHAPHSGTTPKVHAKTNARINAKCPNSAIIIGLLYRSFWEHCRLGLCLQGRLQLLEAYSFHRAWRAPR